MFLQSHSSLAGVYIRADGTSDLSAEIPFAAGAWIQNGERLKFDFDDSLGSGLIFEDAYIGIDSNDILFRINGGRQTNSDGYGTPIYMSGGAATSGGAFPNGGYVQLRGGAAADGGAGGSILLAGGDNGSSGTYGGVIVGLIGDGASSHFSASSSDARKSLTVKKHLAVEGTSYLDGRVYIAPTSGDIVQTLTQRADSETFWLELVPNKYNDTTGLTTEPPMKKFNLVVSGPNPAAGSAARPNRVLVLGYNVNGDGAREDTGDCSFGDRWETYYNPSSTNIWFERHWEVWGRNGNQYRALSCVWQWSTLDRTGVPTIQVDTNVDKFSFNSKGGATQYFLQNAGNFFAMASSSCFVQNNNNVSILKQLNAASSAYKSLIYLDSSDYVQLGTSDITVSVLGNYRWKWSAAANNAYVWDVTDSSAAGPIVKFLDYTVSRPGGLSPGDPRTYLDPIGGLNTISYINIAGYWAGTGSSFKILGPFETGLNTGIQTLMLGVRSDVNGAAVQIASSGSTESYPLLCGINASGSLTVNFAVDRDGSLWWGNVTSISDIADSVETYRTALPANMGPAMDIRLYRNAGTLTCTSPMTIDQDLTVSSTLSVASICRLAGGPTDYVVTGPILTAPQATPGGTHGLFVRKQTTSSAVIANIIEGEWAGTGSFANAVQGCNIFVHTITGTTGNMTLATSGGGMRSRAITRQRGSGTIAKASGYSFQWVQDSSTGTVTDYACLNLEAPSIGSSATTTNWYGVLGETNAIIGNLTNAYWLFLPALQHGTNKFEIWLGTSAGIFFRESGNKINSSAAATLDVIATTTLNLSIGGTAQIAIASNSITVKDGCNFVFNTTTGTKLGTGTTQKIGVWNNTPIARPSGYTQTYSTASKTHSNPVATSVTATAATNVTPWGYSTQAQADAIVTAINNLITDVANVKQVLNSVIDDHQSIGWLA